MHSLRNLELKKEVAHQNPKLDESLSLSKRRTPEMMQRKNLGELRKDTENL
jgi:hypothetical protein